MTGHTSYVNRIERINANQVATVSDDSKIIVWNLNTSTLINTYHGHMDKIQGITVLPNGFLASCGNDRTIRVWDVNSQLLVSTISLPNIVYSLKWSAANGLFVANLINYLAMFNPNTYAVTNTIYTNKTYYGIEILQPSGNLIVGGSINLDIYSLPSLTLNLSQVASQKVRTIKLLPDNVTVVIGCDSGQLMLFNTVSNAIGATLTAHGTGKLVLMLAVTPDQLYVMSGAKDNMIIMWTWSTMSLTQVKSSASAATLNYGAILSGAFAGCKKINHKKNQPKPYINSY
jgi:WD40 repeat protein